jgi:hypothetical protein
MGQPAGLLRALLITLLIIACVFLIVILPIKIVMSPQTFKPPPPREMKWLEQTPLATQKPRESLHERATRANVMYGGGPVMAGTTSVYAIFWEPAGNVEQHYNGLIERYFNDVGGSSLYRIARQYKQANGGFPANAVLAGVWNDTRAYHANPLLDSDIQQEVTHAQQVNGWHSSLNNLFFVFTERNEDLCTDRTHSMCASNGYCAYHSNFGKNSLYAIVPYSTSFECDDSGGPNRNDADQSIDSISHELMESVTDPLGNAWIDSGGNEIADKCVDDFGSLNAQGANVVWNTHPYRVQKEWDNQTRSCRLTPASLL